MAFDDPIVFILVLVPLVIIAFVYLVVKVAKFAWGSNASTAPMQTSSDTKFCLKCGTKIPKMSEFCPSCGTKQILA